MKQLSTFGLLLPLIIARIEDKLRRVERLLRGGVHATDNDRFLPSVEKASRGREFRRTNVFSEGRPKQRGLGSRCDDGCLEGGGICRTPKW